MTNSEVVYAVYRSVRESAFDAFRELCDPGVIWTQNAGFPNGGVRVGPEAVVEGVFERFRRDWTSWCYEVERMIEHADQVIVFGTYAGVFARTRKSMRAEAVHVFWLREGRVTAFKQYADTKVVHDAMV